MTKIKDIFGGGKMSIMDSKSQYEVALRKAHQEYPLKASYSKKPDEC